jgi:hypothetical protein
MDVYVGWQLFSSKRPTYGVQAESRARLVDRPPVFALGRFQLPDLH